jgi:asparagine synthase (glutamine-hydrolysing)
MCGINGIFAYGSKAAPVDRPELIATRERMAMRGPDGAGEWLSDDGRIAFGHRRLSIIDLSESGGRQPMSSADGRFVVTFNGEIYNHRELRRELEAQGAVFRSESDTEVLLHLYAQKGEEMVRELRGMFAFGLWDAIKRSLLLARDPYGIKPLYYADTGGTLRFASQVKALLAGGAVVQDSDPEGWRGFYLFGAVPEPFTTYRAIRALPAGSTVIDAAGVKRVRRYHSVAQVYASADRSAWSAPLVERRHAVADALLQSVKAHLVADVPVGAFLSAGIDSGSLVALMRDAGQADIQTCTLAFAEFDGLNDDEAPIAAEVARRYHARHTIRRVTRAEFEADLPLILEAMDQPSIDGVNTWFVSKAAHELGLKVAISGVGGDELFGGYPSFEDIPRWVSWLYAPSRVPFLGRALRGAANLATASRASFNPKLAGLFEYGGTYAGSYLLRRGLFMPWEVASMIPQCDRRDTSEQFAPLEWINEAITPDPGDAFTRVATLEQSLYMRNQLLRDTDWASMAHSLEVRTPLVDAHLLKQVAEIGPTGEPGAPKLGLALAPSQPLPDSVIRRAKTGFGIPIAPWLNKEPTVATHLFGQSREWARYLATGSAALSPTAAG